MTARRSPAQRLSCLTALMGLTVNTPALGLRPEPPPHTKTRSAAVVFWWGGAYPTVSATP